MFPRQRVPFLRSPWVEPVALVCGRVLRPLSRLGEVLPSAPWPTPWWCRGGPHSPDLYCEFWSLSLRRAACALWSPLLALGTQSPPGRGQGSRPWSALCCGPQCFLVCFLVLDVVFWAGWGWARPGCGVWWVACVKGVVHLTIVFSSAGVCQAVTPLQVGECPCRHSGSGCQLEHW